MTCGALSRGPRVNRTTFELSHPLLEFRQLSFELFSFFGSHGRSCVPERTPACAQRIQRLSEQTTVATRPILRLSTISAPSANSRCWIRFTRSIEEAKTCWQI